MYASRRLRAWRGHLGREEVEVSQECRKRRIVFHPDDPPHSNLISVRESVGGGGVAQYFFCRKHRTWSGYFFFFFTCSFSNTNTTPVRAGKGPGWKSLVSSLLLLLLIPLHQGICGRRKKEGQLFPPPPPFRQNMAAGPGSNFREVAIPPSGVIFFFFRS